MSFFDKAFNLAKTVGTVAYDTLDYCSNKIRETREKYEDMDDDELLRVFFRTRLSLDRAVVYEILKKRGYDNDAIKARKSDF